MATDIQKLRLLIGDTGDTPHFTDGQLNTFFDLAADVLYIAAAMALESWAATLSDSTESEKIGDYSYTKKEADNKLSLAKHYRTLQAELEAVIDTTPAVTWAEFNLTDIEEEEE